MISEVRGKWFFLEEDEGCSDCGNFVIIHDSQTGDQICNRCGIVQEEKIIIDDSIL